MKIIVMKAHTLAAAMLIASSTLALAQSTTADPNAKPADRSVQNKQIKDQQQAPGASEGASTGEGVKAADPAAKPADSSISNKQMKDQQTAPGAADGASTGEGAKAADPSAKPADSSPAQKQMKDSGTAPSAESPQ